MVREDRSILVSFLATLSLFFALLLSFPAYSIVRRFAVLNAGFANTFSFFFLNVKQPAKQANHCRPSASRH